MNCKEFQQNLREFCRNEVAVLKLHGPMLEHAKECHRCGARFEEERALSAALVELTDSMRDETAPASMEAGLLQAFRRAKSGEHAAGDAGVSIRKLRLDWTTFSTAAAFLILFGITLLAFHQGLQEPNGVEPRAPAITGVDQSQTQEYGYQTNFIDLGNYQDPDYWRGSQLLRVNLPRTSLLLFGLPMNAEHAEKMIPAEVLVGEDGVPRAIRFIQTVEYNRTR